MPNPPRILDSTGTPLRMGDRVRSIGLMREADVIAIRHPYGRPPVVDLDLENGTGTVQLRATEISVGEQITPLFCCDDLTRITDQKEEK